MFYDVEPAPSALAGDDAQAGLGLPADVLVQPYVTVNKDDGVNTRPVRQVMIVGPLLAD